MSQFLTQTQTSEFQLNRPLFTSRTALIRGGLTALLYFIQFTVYTDVKIAFQGRVSSLFIKYILFDDSVVKRKEKKDILLNKNQQQQQQKTIHKNLPIGTVD